MLQPGGTVPPRQPSSPARAHNASPAYRPARPSARACSTRGTHLRLWPRILSVSHAGSHRVLYMFLERAKRRGAIVSPRGFLLEGLAWSWCGTTMEPDRSHCIEWAKELIDPSRMDNDDRRRSRQDNARRLASVWRFDRVRMPSQCPQLDGQPGHGALGYPASSSCVTGYRSP